MTSWQKSNTIKIVGALVVGMLMPILVTVPSALIVYKESQHKYQTAIETVIVDVRGCDVIQFVQDDKLIAAFPAPDQPKTCKVDHAQDKPTRGKK